MPLRDRVQLLPPVPDRYALMWNKQAVASKKYEISFTYRAIPHENQDGMFAVWLGSENFTASYDEQAIIGVRNWTQGLMNVGLTFFGNRPTFRGVGIIFLGVDRENAPRPSVTGVVCDGVKLFANSDFPAEKEEQTGAFQTKFIDWRKSGVEVKIQIKDASVIASLKAPDSTEFVQLFSLPAETLFRDWTEAFVGFSGVSGSTSSLELDMSRFQIRNFDSQRVGEDSEDWLKDTLEEEAAGWLKVLEEEKRYIDQRSQKQAVERLTKLLSDHTEKYNNVGEKLKSDLLWMEKRILTLETDISGLTSTLQAYNPQTGNMDADLVKEHIRDISSIISRHTDAHDKKLKSVHDVARDLKAKGADVLGAEGRAKVDSVASQARSMEETASTGTLQTNGLLIVLILAVAVLGLLFLNRMRYYEKKHYI